MEIFLEVAKIFGVPMALLAVMAWYHVGVVKEHAKVVLAKDAELTRVQELRVSESRSAADKLMERETKWVALLGDIDKTLSTLASHIR